MRMPRFRFTIRRMMVAVAIVGALFGVLGLWQRSAAYAAIAERHADEELAIVALALDALTARDGPRLPTGLTLRMLMSRAVLHHKLARKYRRAARYPWLPVAPDPPEPE
jgi:hypothetical protein